MDIKEKIKWGGSPNFVEGRKDIPIRFIVDHVTEGSLSSVDDWFNNPDSNASTHFCIGRKGEIHQYVSSKDTAWGNGYVSNPDNPVWIELGAINPNLASVSIEWEGYSGQPFTEEQYQAALELHIYLIDTYNLEYDKDHIIGHYRIDPQTRSGCPGPTFPWERLLSDLASHYAEKEPVKNEPVPDKLEGLPDEVKQALLTIEENWKVVNEYLNK